MKKGFLIFLSIGLTPCSAFSEQTKYAKQENFSPITNIQLGAGFLQNAKLPISAVCLKSKKMGMKGALVKELKMTKTVDAGTLANTLNLDVKAKAGWGKFSLSAEADYYKKVKGDDYSLNFTYQSLIYGNFTLDSSDDYGLSALTPSAAAAYNMSMDNFVRKCGDSYIKELQMGAVLDVTMQIHFSNQEQKRKFEASVEGRAGDVFTASAKLKSEIESNNYSGIIEVYAFQRGGNPTHLDDIFGSGAEHHVVRCSLKALDECNKAIDDIINYAQGNGIWADRGFANQVKLKNGQIEADSLYPVKLNEATIGSYEDDFGLNTAKVIPTVDVIRAREDLNQLYDEQAKKAVFTNAVTYSSGFKYLDKNVRAKLEEGRNKFDSNMSVFTDGRAMDCFLPTTQNQCPEIVSNIKASLRPVDYSLFELLDGAYYVNVNYNWPTIYVKMPDGHMQVYNTSLIAVGTITHDLKLTPASNYAYISLGGGYSTYLNNIQTRYYMDYYGQEDLVYQNPNGVGYIGNPPWNTCVDGRCSKKYFAMEIIPF